MQTKPMYTTGTININGRTISIALVAQPAISRSMPLLKKENRAALSKDKRNDLFNKVTKAQMTKFDLLTLTLSEEDKLDDTNNLGIQVAQLKHHFVKYDMDDVFAVAMPVPSTCYSTPPAINIAVTAVQQQ